MTIWPLLTAVSLPARRASACSDIVASLLEGDAIQSGMPPFPLDRVADHVLHALEVAGPRHVALGADFDGIDRRPAGLEDASGYPALLEVLARRGVDEETLGLVAYHNAARAIAAATSLAAAR